MAIVPTLGRIGSSYSRVEPVKLLRVDRISCSREGLYPDGDRIIFLSPSIRKTKTQTFRASIIFASGVFHWESQITQSPHQKNIRIILSGKIVLLLIVREATKV